MNTYIFTDERGKKVLERRMFGWTNRQTPAERAEKHRLRLQKERKEVVVAWAHMD